MTADTTAAPRRRPADVTVLVVDDEPDVTMYLASVLEDAGINVETANDGHTALERIRARTPDLISLDLVMPGTSGIRLLHELRKHHEWKRIPVLIVTGHGRDETVRRDLDGVLSGSSLSGPSLYLEKPVTPEAYLRHICHTLKVDLPDDPRAEATRPASLRQQVENALDNADEATLRQALAALTAHTGSGRPPGKE